MFGANAFDMFGNIQPVGASNPMGAAISGLNAPQTAPIGSNMVGMGGVTAGMNLPANNTLGGQGNNGLGFNLGTGQLVLGGIQAIGNIWAAMEAQKLGREQFNFQKGITNTNLANQITSYNTTLADRIKSRSFTEGRPDGYAEQYIEDNKLRDQR
jgi:hypothetical protein